MDRPGFSVADFALSLPLIRGISAGTKTSVSSKMCFGLERLALAITLEWMESVSGWSS